MDSYAGVHINYWPLRFQLRKQFHLWFEFFEFSNKGSSDCFMLFSMIMKFYSTLSNNPYKTHSSLYDALLQLLMKSCTLLASVGPSRYPAEVGRQKLLSKQMATPNSCIEHSWYIILLTFSCYFIHQMYFTLFSTMNDQSTWLFYTVNGPNLSWWEFKGIIKYSYSH